MNNNNENKLDQSLKSRHIGMIALGGCIGTGLFLGSGSAISEAGPGGAVVAYGLMGIIVFFLMTSLGEMATELPLSGSFEAYAGRFIDPALGFTLGWNYWFSWAIVVASELVAGGIIMKFWFPNSSSSMWAIIFLVFLFVLNAISTKMFGETEFWFAGIKVTTVIVFLFVGILMIIGVIGGDSPGFSNWTISDADGNKGPFPGGFVAVLNVFLLAGFCFQGTELIGVAASETENPAKNIPLATRTTFFRILLFYLGTMIVIGFLIPFTDEHLLNAATDNVACSPFTIVFKNAGLDAAANIMNAIILTAVLSCGNSSMYASTRILFAMGNDGRAPKMFGKLNKRRVPMNALIITSVVAAFSFFSSLIGDGKIYYLCYNAGGITGFFTWMCIAMCAIRFRQAMKAQGRDVSELKYKSPFYPAGPVISLIFCTFIMFFANVWVFSEFTWFDFISNYILIPVIPLVYFIFKKVKKTKIVKLEEVNLTMDD